MASGKRISPGSSIPFEIARIYRLKKKKPKRKYVNDSQRSRRLGVGRGGTQRTACSRHGRKDPYLLWQSSKLLLSEWQRFSKYACKKKENQTLRGCSLFFIRSKATENCTRNVTFKWNSRRDVTCARWLWELQIKLTSLVTRLLALRNLKNYSADNILKIYPPSIYPTSVYPSFVVNVFDRLFLNEKEWINECFWRPLASDFSWKNALLALSWRLRQSSLSAPPPPGLWFKTVEPIEKRFTYSQNSSLGDVSCMVQFSGLPIAVQL